MQLENRFDVPASPEAAWSLLNDVPAVLPCMPGAQLLEVVDPDRWKASLHVRLGPISLQFFADVSRETTDPGNRRAVLSVNAREAKGRGTAHATITSIVEESTAGTHVSLLTDLALRGPLAQYGRIVVAPVAEQLTEQFATCIAKKLAPTTRDPQEDGEAQPSASTEVAKPIAGMRLLLAAFRRALVRGRTT